MQPHELKVGLEVVDGPWKGIVDRIFEGRATCIVKGERPAGEQAEWEARVERLELSEAEKERQLREVEQEAASHTITLRLTYTQAQALRWAVGFADLKPGEQVPTIPMYEGTSERRYLHCKGGIQDWLDQRLRDEVERILAKREHDRIVKEAGLDKDNLGEGTWECETSPTGICWYDYSSSMGEDECIFCGDPDERK
jgi:hypothetical protein